MNTEAFLTAERKLFHSALLASVLRTDATGIPANADRHSLASIRIASGVIERLGAVSGAQRLAGQSSGRKFESLCAEFIARVFPRLSHLRPGRWTVASVGSRNRLLIARFEQYSHLIALDQAARKDAELAAALGADYTITPDIIISREPEDDEIINTDEWLVDDASARLTALRKRNGGLPLLHASISCKWTIRSDRSQNSRSEALNLIRNRKGHLPHIVVVTGEPLPARIASIALGTGDIDCVYHFAVPEMIETVRTLNFADAEEMLDIMVNGKRLKDVSDLPPDLAI
jgi:hypothetical protein